MKILMIDGKLQNFDTYRDLFKYLGKEEYYINNIENGKMTLKHDEEELEALFGEINVENSITPFNEEVKEYINELKVAKEALTELGVGLTDEQKAKLNNMFGFLN